MTIEEAKTKAAAKAGPKAQAGTKVKAGAKAGAKAEVKGQAGAKAGAKAKAKPEAGLKALIAGQARELGCQLVGFASLERYRQLYPGSASVFHPDSVWPEARGVIVLGAALPLPIVESTPSINYQELYNTVNVLLDQAAYRLSISLSEAGHPSICLPRDGYADLSYLLGRASSSFSHVVAGYLAGLGTIGWSHNLLTPEFGSRVRLNTVLTATPIEPDPMLESDLCLHCPACRRLCPVGALDGDISERFAVLDHDKCTRRHQDLRQAGCWPCGICTKACPVGQDRELYGRRRLKDYYDEAGPRPAGQGNKRIEAWNHIRRFGSELNVR
jgi:epoxyqueuosine reductase QueG